MADTSQGHSSTVDTGYVRGRLARVGALMASIIGSLTLVQIVLGSRGLNEMQSANFWIAMVSALFWAALWLSCKHVPMKVRTLRVVEAVCMGGAMTALAVTARLSTVENLSTYAGPVLANPLALASKIVYEQQLSSMAVTLAMGLALVTRAAMVPTPPRYTAGLTAAMGIPLVMVWVVNPGFFAIASDPGAQSGQPEYEMIPFLAGLWWLVVTIVCYAISRVVHGLRVEVLTARKLGQYTLGEKLGEGGMGEVYKASHSRLRRPTAIKLLPASRSSEQAVARFETEVQLTAELTHPNTITIFDYGRTDDGVFYYAMEHLSGATLSEIVQVAGPQPPSRVTNILEQAAGALQEAHAAGLIHRDIKPANIMLSRQGIDPDAVKVLDFGLVRPLDRSEAEGLTQEGSLLGTPQYMAPETIGGPKSVGPQSDLYALGAVGYFLLTGSHVFSGTNVIQVCAQHLHNVPEPIETRLGQPTAPDLEAVIMMCLAKDPGDRPADAAAMIRQLQACESHAQWTAEDAEEWWSRHGHRLRDVRGDKESSGTVQDMGRTLTIAAG